jgi:hypothetical protein
VGGIQGIGNLKGELQQCFVVERLASNALLEGTALQQLHDHERLALILIDVMNRANMGVIERGGGSRFALESFQGLVIVTYSFGDEFQRYEPAKLDVFGLVHHPHPAAAQFL